MRDGQKRSSAKQYSLIKFLFSVGFVLLLHALMLLNPKKIKDPSQERLSQIKIKPKNGQKIIRSFKIHYSKLTSQTAPKVKEDSPATSKAPLINLEPQKEFTQSLDSKEIQKIMQALSKAQNSIEIPESPLDSMPLDAQLHFVIPEEEDTPFNRDKYYGFKKRLIQIYYDTLIQTYHQFQSKYPEQRFPYTNQSQKVLSLLSFDSQGRIIKSESLQWSDSERLQDFFMEALDKIQVIPNIPQKLYNSEGEFKIGFGLQIQ